jgi:hypothetical protein
LEKDDAVFYALLKMGHECTHAIVPHPNPLSQKMGNTWPVEVEHDHNDLGKHGDYTGIGSWMIQKMRNGDAGKDLTT